MGKSQVEKPPILGNRFGVLGYQSIEETNLKLDIFQSMDLDEFRHFQPMGGFGWSSCFFKTCL